MKIASILNIFGLIIMLTLSTGCRRDLELRTNLSSDEHVAKGANVFVDGSSAGYVKQIRVDEGDRLALIVITDKKIAAERLKVGTVRVAGEDNIQLRTDLAEPDSPVLAPGSLIPTHSKTAFTVRKYGNTQILGFAAVVLIALLLLCLAFKQAFHAALLILCLGFAGLTGWMLHPHVVPHIEKFYAASVDQSDDQTRESMTAADSAASAARGQFEISIVRVLEHRPDPRLAAFGAILVLSFIPYTILIGGAVRSLRRDR